MTEKVPLKKLLSFGSLIDTDTYMQLMSYEMQGAKYVNVPVGTIQELQRRKNKEKERLRILNRTAQLNNRGTEYEKSGKIKQAISTYEKNIEIGYPAHHSYKRLMILYRKSKDYDNEERVIERAIEVFGEYPEYVERLEKLHKIMKK